LVDGGYVDNSGVDTALDIITQVEKNLARDGSVAAGVPTAPKVEIHLIVLSTSEFPERGGYGFGDELEPIRALLSTREARTPIAITRARRQLGAVNEIARNQDCLRDWENTQSYSRLQWTGCAMGAVDRVHEARFRAPFYAMPLGWRLSNFSQDVIGTQSGRFWDCDPGLTYAQQDTRQFSNADCVQLLIYHQLNGTLDEAIKVIELGDDWRQSHREDRAAAPRLNHNEFFNCYSGQLQSVASRIINQITTEPEEPAQSGSQEGPSPSCTQPSRGVLLNVEGVGTPLPSQTAQTCPKQPKQPSDLIEEMLRSTLERRRESAVEQVLQSWDRSQCSEPWLAYLLTVMKYESNLIPYRAGGCLTDKCAWRLVERAMKLGGNRFSETNRRQPNGNSYYKRGIVALNGPIDYQMVSKLTDDPIYTSPDLLLVPEVSARAAFVWVQQLFPAGACTTATEEDASSYLKYYFRKRGHGIRPGESIADMLGSNREFMTCIKAAKIH
jgi:hypothetical protein